MSNHPPKPTFSSSLLHHISLSIDPDTPPSPSPSLRRSRLLQTWIHNQPITPPPPPPPKHRPSPPPPPPPPLPTPDDDPDSFFSTTSVSSSDSGLSSTPSDLETPSSFHPSSKPKSSCFGPFRAPKPIKTTKPKTKVVNNCDSSSSSSSSSSRAVRLYSQLKSLKQPISPGIRLAKYINSLTASKKNKTKNNEKPVPVPERRCYKSEHASPEWSFSSSSFAYKKAGNEGSGIAKDDRVGGVEEVDVNRKVLEEVALDLLNKYWNRRKSGNGDGDGDDKGDDDSSCSSSDLFEIDHLSLIGNDELPVYETTRLTTS